MRRFCFIPLLALVPAFASAPSPDPPPPVHSTRQLLGKSYSLEASVSFHAALLHWLDSLAQLEGPGLTSGKTRRAHVLDFHETLGRPTPEDVEMLKRFGQIRVDFAVSTGVASPDALAAAFFDTDRLEPALARARALLSPEAAATLETAVAHFAPGYRRVFADGKIPREFLERAVSDPRRAQLGRFLAGVARFYGVSPRGEPAPRLILTPVRNGFGTHAQALDRFLLIEIRPGEGLMDEVSPIVHENAHWLFRRMAAERVAALERAALSWGPRGAAAWRLLHEALPTAIAQGVADERFRREQWSARHPWYHVQEIDAYAKQLFPLVKRTLDSGAPFDEAFLRRAVEALDWEGTSEDVPSRSELLPRIVGLGDQGR